MAKTQILSSFFYNFQLKHVYSALFGWAGWPLCSLSVVKTKLVLSFSIRAGTTLKFWRSGHSPWFSRYSLGWGVCDAIATTHHSGGEAKSVDSFIARSIDQISLIDQFGNSLNGEKRNSTEFPQSFASQSRNWLFLFFVFVCSSDLWPQLIPKVRLVYQQLRYIYSHSDMQQK